MTGRADQYFVMTGEGLYPGTAIGKGPSSATGPWFDGTPNTERVRVPLKYTLDRYARGEVLPYYHEWEIPLMRGDLVEALRGAGVDNVELYPATLTIPWTRAVRTDFWAVNVLGLVGDLPSGTRGKATPLMFRMRKSCEAIVVHRLVRDAIERERIHGLTFTSARTHRSI